MISSDDNLSVVKIVSKCENCEQTFQTDEFDQHICQFDSKKNFIYDEKLENILWHQNALRRMLIENRKQIQMILQQSKLNANSQTKANGKMISSNYVCLVCNRIYVHASGLSRHMEIHNMNDIYNQCNSSAKAATVDVFKCSLCGQIFSNLALCFSHLKSAHTEYGIGENDFNEESESRTFEKVSIDQVYQCEFCIVMFVDTTELLQHQLNHDINIGYECSNCEIASRNLKFITNHRNSECPYEKYQKKATEIPIKSQFVCNQCDFNCSFLAQLYEHR